MILWLIEYIEYKDKWKRAKWLCADLLCLFTLANATWHNGCRLCKWRWADIRSISLHPQGVRNLSKKRYERMNEFASEKITYSFSSDFMSTMFAAYCSKRRWKYCHAILWAPYRIRSWVMTKLSAITSIKRKQQTDFMECSTRGMPQLFSCRKKSKYCVFHSSQLCVVPSAACLYRFFVI